MNGEDTILDRVACGDGSVIASLSPGSYDVRIEIDDDAGARFAVSDAEHVELDGDAEVGIELRTREGHVQFTWGMVGQGGAAVECDEVGAFELAYSFSGPGFVLGDSNQCQVAGPEPYLLRVGEYSICLVVRDGEGNLLSEVSVVSETIGFGNQTIDLGDLSFVVPAATPPTVPPGCEVF